MATRRHDIPIERGDGRPSPLGTPRLEPSLGDLFRRLSEDMSLLIRQEIQLAKGELRESGAVLANAGMKLGIALVLTMVGALALGAFLVIALGDLLDNYWLSALLVGVAFVAISGLLAKAAMSRVRSVGLKPEETIRTLREDTSWARREAQELKNEMRS